MAKKSNIAWETTIKLSNENTIYHAISRIGSVLDTPTEHMHIVKLKDGSEFELTLREVLPSTKNQFKPRNVRWVRDSTWGQDDLMHKTLDVRYGYIYKELDPFDGMVCYRYAVTDNDGNNQTLSHHIPSKKQAKAYLILELEMNAAKYKFYKK